MVLDIILYELAFFRHYFRMSSLPPYESILWQSLNVEAGSLHVETLELHRHFPETRKLARHRHTFWQSLTYLSGDGKIQIRGQFWPVHAGTHILLPPGTSHAFQRTGKTPLECLVVEFQLRVPARHAKPGVHTLTVLQMNLVRETLQRIAGLSPETTSSSKTSKPGREREWHRMGRDFMRGHLTLNLLYPLFQASGLIPVPSSQTTHPILARLSKYLQDPQHFSKPTSLIAKELGYQPDYLNRVVKSLSGYTLTQWRDRERLWAARDALSRGLSAGETGSIIGFDDQNYFTRWFKKQSGITPTQWRAQFPFLPTT